MKLIRFSAGTAWFAILLVLVTGKAWGWQRTIEVKSLYGTYTPLADCSREPRVTVGRTGFTFTWHGKTIARHTFENPGAMMGDNYDGIMDTFYPFGDWGSSTLGPVEMTFNPDERPGRLEIRDGHQGGPALTPLQAALVHASPLGKCGNKYLALELAQVAALRAATMHTLDFPADKVKLTHDQAVAIDRALGRGAAVPAADIAQFDLNDDGRPDLIAFHTGNTCTLPGCTGAVVMATPRGYAPDAIHLSYTGGRTADILISKHHGMHDLHGTGSRYIEQWDGSRYVDTKVDLPGSYAAAWTTRNGGDRTVAMAVPVNSSIKTLAVLCAQGKPQLAMVTKVARPAGPITLTFVLYGTAVELPMLRNSPTSTLWTAGLSQTGLLPWLEHRGKEVRQKLRERDVAYLLINGDMQGLVSLANSDAASKAALARCAHH